MHFYFIGKSWESQENAGIPGIPYLQWSKSAFPLYQKLVQVLSAD
ncbi:hypothetical protein [Flavobacterium sp. LC2016-01]|nr:hypothetical protein [Flavobacterium sp. LC2016-01]